MAPSNLFFACFFIAVDKEVGRLSHAVAGETI
jgi:hypothetical protein